MALNHLFFFSWMTVLVTSMPKVLTNTVSTRPSDTTSTITDVHSMIPPNVSSMTPPDVGSVTATDVGSITPSDTLMEMDPHVDEDIKLCDEGNMTITEDSYELGEVLGEFIPTFYSFDYEVNGTFYTIKNFTQKIYIENFSYNGNAPSVYFYVGLTQKFGVNKFYVPTNYYHYEPCNITEGFIVGGYKSDLSKMEEKNLLLTLPTDYTIYNIRWIMVWCRAIGLDMGHVSNTHIKEESTRTKRETSNLKEMDMIPLGDIAGVMYNVQGSLYAINSTHLFLIGFFYDGKAPDAYFYAGSTEKVGVSGYKIPDETGSVEVLRAYENENLTLSLPDGKTVEDIKWFSIFCESYLEDFGHIRLEDGFYENFVLNATFFRNSSHMDGSPSDNEQKMNGDSENKDESKMPSEVESDTEQESEQESEHEYHPEPKPEPDIQTRQEESIGSKVTGSLTTISHQLMITVGLYFLFR